MGNVDIKDILDALRRRWYLPVATVLVALLIASAWIITQTPMYRSTAQLFISSASQGQNTSDQFQAANFTYYRVSTYPQLVNSPEVLGPAVTEVGLDASDADADWSVSAVNPPDTVLLEVTATSSSAAEAAAVANATARSLGAAIERLETTNDKLGAPIKITLTAPAEAAGAPYFPSRTTTLALALLLGLAGGVAWAVLREQLDTTVKSAKDLTDATGGTPMGVIGFDSTAADEPLAALNQKTMRSEAFRSIRTNLNYVDVDNPPRVVALASSMPGEGKSTASCNLAITLAQAGYKVCLVEADLRKPKVAEYLGIDSSVGLTDVLAGKYELSDALLPWRRGLLHRSPVGCDPAEPVGTVGVGTDAGDAEQSPRAVRLRDHRHRPAAGGGRRLGDHRRRRRRDPDGPLRQDHP